MSAFFGMIGAMSPLWWLALALGLGMLEMLTMTAFLIWPGLAALAMAVIHALFPGLSGEVLVALFAVLAVVLTYLGKGVFLRGEHRRQAESGLNQRSRRMVGRIGAVVEHGPGRGIVEIDGMRWNARWDVALAPAGPGARIEVVEAEGLTLVVRPA